MFKKVKHLKNQKGLTLVELLAVIVILAIIAAIAIPSIGNIVDNSRAKAQVSDAINVLNAANIYFTDNPTVASIKGSSATASDTTLISTGYLENTGKITDITVTNVEGGSNTITFTFTGGVKVGGAKNATVTTTLDKLTNAKVSKGDITLTQ